jgi:putative flippase GtrA
MSSSNASTVCRRRERRPARYVKFLSVGCLNAIVDLGVLNLLLWCHPTHTPWLLTLYNTVAVTCAVLNSYVWNRFWTFRDQARGDKREFLLYIVQALMSIVLNDAVLTATAAWLDTLHRLSPVWVDNLAKGTAMLTSSSVTYLCLRWWVFRRRGRAWA